MDSVGEYKIIKYIGKGAFSTVYLANRNEHPYILKIFNKFNNVDSDIHTQDVIATNEINILTKITNSNIANCNHIIEPLKLENRYVIVLTYNEGVSLGDFSLKQTLPIDDAKHIGKILLEVLNNIHAVNVAHMDIKPANILYDFKTQTVTLIDFGLSIETGINHLRGSLRYISSTVIRNIYQNKFASLHDLMVSDYFALGISLYMLVNDHYPYTHRRKPPIRNEESYTSSASGDPELDSLIDSLILTPEKF
jgi:serine/threonine protein kinase